MATDEACAHMIPAAWLATNIHHAQEMYTTICDCLSENPPSSHLQVFREIPF